MPASSLVGHLAEVPIVCPIGPVVRPGETMPRSRGPLLKDPCSSSFLGQQVGVFRASLHPGTLEQAPFLGQQSCFLNGGAEGLQREGPRKLYQLARQIEGALRCSAVAAGLEILRRTRSFPERTSSAGSVAAILWQLETFVYRESPASGPRSCPGACTACLHGVEELQELSHVGLGDLRLRGSSLCCAGQRRRHAEHHGRLLLHGGH